MNPTTATEYRNLPLNVLIPSKTNPRRIVEDDSLRELAESISVHGVLEPLIVRPVTDRDFEVVVGGRRFAASKKAGKDDAPCSIRNLTDAQVLEIQLVENLQRRDVHPLEEAHGFHALLKLEEPKYTIEQIGAKVGKAPAYVASRARLRSLSRQWLRRSMPRRSALDMPCFWRSSNQPNRKPLWQAASARIGAEPQGKPSASSFPSGISSIG
jgi:ParB family chromosome partitioning protein